MILFISTRILIIAAVLAIAFSTVLHTGKNHHFHDNSEPADSSADNNRAGFMIIDRFEGDFAVVETSGGTMIDIPRADMPPAAKEGDMLHFMVDNTSIDSRREFIEKKAERLFR